MSETSYPGIDYGMGQTNVDRSTGIRYGVISANAGLTEWFWEDVESVYLPSCPHCDNKLDDGWEDESDQYNATQEAIGNGIATEAEIDDLCDPICPHCYKAIEDGEQWPDCDEPAANVIDSDGVKGHVDDSNDVWVTESPFYTRAQFCSPCAPGAGYLGNPCDDGPKTYCLGHDWFEGGKAPYTVYRVDDDSVVEPEEK